ncbi:stage III sporulation protein AA [Paenibacillus sp. JX-17]|uniref:Stage III sporulation protein AA n=1 Tax=Paenibacillus lacisoli TaxID=3064525 RepID=A0ABT9C7G1_9BACL|nr:stage III sporulation protein AA [Paenibacillus sp. JX-17]MDO7905175.1 stage III sporulation protein AA [Paenibacillus sp. JX-17]
MRLHWLELFPDLLQRMLRSLPDERFTALEEVRIREGRALEINTGGDSYFVTPDGELTSEENKAYKPGREDTYRLLDTISNHSLYTMEEELRKGFITLPGGHRVGLAGRTVLSGGAVEHLRDISSFNVRIARELPGIADNILPFLWDESGGRLHHTLILSPPQQGKTTLIRDLARQISTGTGYEDGANPFARGQKVGIVDERSEIAGSHKGVPGFDVGPRTDVMDGCPKAEGMMMMIRSMSPEVLIVDEIGRTEDAYAVQEAMQAGISVIATAHGRELAELSRRPAFSPMLSQELFQRYVLLQRKGSVISFRVADAKQRMMIIPDVSRKGRDRHA